MELAHQIEELIERVRPLMPSDGAWPFTLLTVKREALSGLNFEGLLRAEQQLIVLIRTDFTRSDLVDYLSNTEEFDSIPAYAQEHFLNAYVCRLLKPGALSSWSERIAGIAIGAAIHLAAGLNLCVENVEADLSALDASLSFPQRNLKAIQLYDISFRIEQPDLY